MKLSDADIEEYVNNMHITFDFSKEAVRMTLKDARDFYENQKCETCGKNASEKDICRVYLRHEVKPVDSFGCTDWEPKS